MSDYPIRSLSSERSQPTQHSTAVGGPPAALPLHTAADSPFPDAGYEYTKRHLSQPQLLGDGMLTYMTSGAVGGISYWLACYPLDVVKSRVQLAGSPPAKGGLPAVGYVGRELRAIVREGGP
jgi:hypothetical protein